MLIDTLVEKAKAIAKIRAELLESEADGIVIVTLCGEEHDGLPCMHVSDGIGILAAQAEKKVRCTKTYQSFTYDGVCFFRLVENRLM